MASHWGIKDWRVAVLGLLFFGPFAVFVGLGWAWVHERGWALPAFLIWMCIGIVFSVLSVRWTRTRKPVLTPLDWSAPHTFAPRDREAWNLIAAEAEHADQASMDQLTSIQFFFDTGTRIATKLSAHYHPGSSDPMDEVPLVEMLTALELAAEDLRGMVREVPGGDIVTLGHWKKAVSAANFVSKANEFYSYLMPLVQPVQGLMRLGTQKLMAQPAWKSMRENVLRWFYKAYIQRLGMHLIGLYSGRLAVGAAAYRRLTQGAGVAKAADEPLAKPPAMRIGVVGAPGALKQRFLDDWEQARASLASSDHAPTRGGDIGNLARQRVSEAVVLNLEGYPPKPGRIPLKSRLHRQGCLRRAVQCDVVMLLVDAGRADLTPEVQFLQDWAAWFKQHPELERPPVLAILVAPASSERASGLGSEQERSEQSARQMLSRLEAMQQALPPDLLIDMLCIGVDQAPRGDVSSKVLPWVLSVSREAERAALIRELHAYGSRSKVVRVAAQVGKQGKKLLGSIAETAKQRFTKKPGPNAAATRADTVLKVE